MLNVTAKIKDFRWKCKVLPTICISSPSLQQVDKCPPPRLLETGGRACWSEYGCMAAPLRTSPRSPLRSNDPSHPSQTPMITLAPRRQRAAESRSKRPKESQNNGPPWRMAFMQISIDAASKKSRRVFKWGICGNQTPWPGKMLRWCWWQAFPLGRWWRWLLGTSLTTHQPGPLQPN